MSYVLGIDIGTSFTAAAIAHLGEDDSPVPQTLSLGLHTSTVPSVVFMDDDGQVVVGEAAERRGLSHPDRVVREFKRRVGDTVPIIAGDLAVAPEDIFAVVARWVADRAEEREGAPPQAVTISHPAGWGEYKTGLIREALAGVGLSDITLLSEPEAAALHYGSQERVDVGSTVAVYDLGGGTFDAALLRKSSPVTFEPLGRPAGIERLGGADFDEAVFGHVTASMGEAFGQLDPTDPSVLVALSRVRRECREAKEALSADSEATIPVFLPGTHNQVRLVRSEFEAMIAVPVRETVETLSGTLETAGIESRDVSVILLIGGSSRIPFVAQMLSEHLGRPIAVDADPKASICLGAVFAAAAQSIKAAPAAAAADQDADDDGQDVAALAGAQAGPEAEVGVFEPPRPARHKTKPPRTGVRMMAIGAGALLVTGLTAVAAQGPGSLGPLTSFSAEQAGGGGEGPSQEPKQEPEGGSGDDGGQQAKADPAEVSGASSKADAATTGGDRESGSGDDKDDEGGTDGDSSTSSSSPTDEATDDSSSKTVSPTTGATATGEPSDSSSRAGGSTPATGSDAGNTGGTGGGGSGSETTSSGGDSTGDTTGDDTSGDDSNGGDTGAGSGDTGNTGDTGAGGDTDAGTDTGGGEPSGDPGAGEESTTPETPPLDPTPSPSSSTSPSPTPMVTGAATAAVDDVTTSATSTP